MNDPANSYIILGRMPLSERLDREINRSDRRGDCLITKAYLRGGYGSISYKCYPRHLHRLILERKIGRLLTAAEWACHTCDMPACINQDHLYVGNVETNTRDRIVRKRAAIGSAHGSAKVTEPDVVAIRDLYRKGWRLFEIAPKYAISPDNVSRIVKRKTWRHV